MGIKGEEEESLPEKQWDDSLVKSAFSRRIKVAWSFWMDKI